MFARSFADLLRSSLTTQTTFKIIIAIMQPNKIIAKQVKKQG
jgi:hypothetical protein